jgi:DNA-binding NarL/FixJ family response regulator
MPIGRTIRVQIADDHDVVIQGLRSILNSQTNIEVIEPPITSGNELFNNIRTAQPDVLLLDVQMPDFDVLTSLTQLAAFMPRLRIIIITAQRDPQLVKAAAERGAAGYILKEEALSNLLPLAIQDVFAGGLWFSPKASQYLIRGGAKPIELSIYQLDVLRLMVHGDTPEAIASALQRSVSAIYSAQTQIREKLGVQTNEQAIVAALRERLVPLGLE